MEQSYLIDLLLKRDENALLLLDEAYNSKMKSMCLNLGLNSYDTEECINDTLLTLWNKIPPEKPEFLHAFMFKILRRKAIDKIRTYTAKKRNVDIDLIYSELNDSIPDKARVEDSFDENELVIVINGWLETIDELSRYIFINRYFYAKSVSQIKLETGLSQSNVTTKLHRLRVSLKTKLEKEGVICE